MASLLFILAQGGAWLQHNLQFKYPKLGPEWWGWYVAALPITWSLNQHNLVLRDSVTHYGLIDS